MSLYGLFKGRGPSGFGYNDTAEDVTAGVDLKGKTYVVTGCNSGLGAETVRVLALRGARVLATARTVEKAADACKGMPGDTVPLALELSEPASVRAAVAEVRTLAPSIDGIVANAGIMALPARQLQLGYELQFFTNHVGHFLFVTGLLDRLAPKGRVVMLSSAAHFNAYAEGIRLDDLSAEKGYTPWGAYGQSKLANLLFARHLATRLPEGQTASAVHPGVIATNLVRHMGAVQQFAWTRLGPVAFLKSIPQGTATQCYVAANPAVTKTGEYWADCNVAPTSSHGMDGALAASLWTKTEEIVASLPA